MLHVCRESKVAMMVMLLYVFMQDGDECYLRSCITKCKGIVFLFP